jgi:nucleoid DNA-binding protein
MTSKAPNINRKMLASMLAEWSEDYLVYECEDFIDLFTEVIEQLVKEGHIIALDGFGSFQPKLNPAFTTKSLTSDERCTYPESTTLKFTPAVSLQKRIKASTKEKNDAVS